MKTSNKILLTLFLLPFLVCSFLSIALYAKYRSNDYTTEAQFNEENHTASELPAFANIHVSNFNGHVNIEYSNDRALRMEKWNKDKVQYEVKNNTLFISSIRDHYVPVTILCPFFEQLDADSARLSIRSYKLKNAVFNLGHAANMDFNGQADTLSIAMKNSSNLDFNSQATVGLLNLVLDDHASFESFGQISRFGNVQVKDSADIRMDGKTMRSLLEKANLAP
ncbi:MAG: DUF2807 domain-containing protein [Chitinophagaceae bacterium]|nr:DUF2807 domain-containing protein [Chitinophagaceae bacterium]